MILNPGVYCAVMHKFACKGPRPGAYEALGVHCTTDDASPRLCPINNVKCKKF